MDLKRKARFKTCRRLGLNVVGHPKAMDRYRKGMGRADGKLSNYGKQLLEKQRLRAYFHVSERQMMGYAKKALASKENSKSVLLDLLERRLDNLVYRAGFASSIRQARQMVVHGHLRINGKKVDRPSFQVAVGDVLSLSEKMKDSLFAKQFEAHGPSTPYLLAKGREVVLLRKVSREELPILIDEHLVVEYYAKKA